MKPGYLGGLLLASGTFATGCVVSVDTHAQIAREEKRFTVTGSPDLRLTTFDGSIEIRSWDRAEVLVEIEKRGPTNESIEALEVISSQQGSRIDLEVKQPRRETFSGVGFHHSATARLIVSVPREVSLQARSGDGSMHVEGVRGRIDLRTGDGSIRAADLSGDITMNTGDGSVSVTGVEGRLEVDTGDGGVTIDGSVSRLKVNTGDGSIVYRAGPDSRMTEDWELTTGDGGVTLYLPANFAADLDAHTGDGSIRSDLTVDSGGEDREQRRRTLRGRLGGGGRSLRIRTGDGTIRLRAS